MVAAPAWFGLDEEQLSLARQVAVRHDYLQHGVAHATTDVDDEAARLVRDRFLLVAPDGEVTGGPRRSPGSASTASSSPGGCPPWSPGCRRSRRPSAPVSPTAVPTEEPR